MKIFRSSVLALTAPARSSAPLEGQHPLSATPTKHTETTMSSRSWMRGVIALALTSLVAGCVVAEENVAEENVDEASEALSTFSAAFRDTSTMRGGGADWDPQHGKATCAPGEAITGISVLTSDHQGRTALCESVDTSVFTGNATATLTLDARVDQRRATRNGDWAPGFLKLECGAGEYVRGVSENTEYWQWNHGFHAIQCASGGASLGQTTCTTRTFDIHDDRGTNQSGDWDVNANKGECESDEYVAGVSADLTSGGPHSLLCCHIEQPLPGKTFWGSGALMEFAATTTDACTTACRGNTSCTGGTFNPGKQWCWLRTGAGDIQGGLGSDYAFTIKPAQRTGG